MASLQQYVPNVPLQVAKNLRFDDDNGIPVTQMLPIGMNGINIADSPKTGYISRIAAVLSGQIDLYNQVVETLENYATRISDLELAVEGLETSGTTIPIVDGKCFTGNANSPITTVVELMATSACSYISVLGTPSALTAAVLAEGASTLNVMPAFSQNSDMAGLSGWKSAPTTIADSHFNLWLAYLDSRDGVEEALSVVTPTCSQVIIDFMATYTTAAANGSGFRVYFSGYSFIPTGYTDNGSTVTIKDGSGGIFTTAIDILQRSIAGADPLFVGISGTALSLTSSNYQVTVNSAIIRSGNSCSKTVIHDTKTIGSSSVVSSFDTGNYSANISGSTVPIDIVTGLSYTPKYVSIEPANQFTGDMFKKYGYYVATAVGGASVSFANSTSPNDIGTFNVNWIAYK